MEDASGIDLDWFWRGWFYTTDHVDIAATGIRAVEFDTMDPYTEKPKQKAKRDAERPSVGKQRNGDLPKRIRKFSDLHDFYNEYDDLDITEQDKKAYEKFMEKLSDSQKATLSNLPNAYVVDFENVGGLVMPLVLELTFEDGSTESRVIPAEIWRRDNKKVSKLMITEKRLTQIQVDPHREIADASEANNFFPRRIEPVKVDLPPSSKRGDDDKSNPMRKALGLDDESKDEDKAESEAESEAEDADEDVDAEDKPKKKKKSSDDS